MFRLLRRSFSTTSYAVRPEVKKYHVRLALNKNRVGFPVGLAIGFLALATGERDANPFKTLVSEEPLHIPLGLTQKVDPEPYKPGCKEVVDFRRFQGDRKSRVVAEKMIVQQVLRVVERNRKIDLGRPVHCARNYWMWFNLPPPPPKYVRNYLALSNKGVDYVTRPVDPFSAHRLNSNLYPRAIASSLYSFGASLSSSLSAVFKPEDPTKPKLFPRPPIPMDKSLGPPGIADEIDGESLISPATKAALDSALMAGIDTLEKSWSKDRQPPPPPRGMAVAEGVLHVVGSKLALVLDIKAAVDPNNPAKCVILSMKIRYGSRAPRGGLPENMRFQW